MTFQEKFKLLKPVVWPEGLAPDAELSEEQVRDVSRKIMAMWHFDGVSVLVALQLEQSELIKELLRLGEQEGLDWYEVETQIYQRLYPATVDLGYPQAVQFHLEDALGWEIAKKRNNESNKEVLKFLWRRSDGLRLGEWSDALKQYSWPFMVMNMSESFIKTAIDSEDMRATPADREQAHRELQEFLESLPKEEFPDALFIKVGSVAPKDYLIDPEKRRCGVRQCRTAKDIIVCLSGSMRAEEHLIEAYGIKAQVQLVVRPYLSLEERNEFRVFIYKGKVIGVSQMWLQENYHYTVAEREAIMSHTQDFIAKIHPHVGRESYSIDMYLEGARLEEASPVLIEINPFYGGLNPLLFHSKVFDGSLQVLED